MTIIKLLIEIKEIELRIVLYNNACSVSHGSVLQRFTIMLLTAIQIFLETKEMFSQYFIIMAKIMAV